MGSGSGTELPESGPDHFVVGIFKHSTIFWGVGWAFLITIQSQVHNNLRNVCTEIHYKVHLVSFTKMSTVDSEIVPKI